MEKFILSCSKGLAEVTKTKDQTVQFIHESVRDFLLQRNGLSKLQSDLANNVAGSSKERLKQCCHRYITINMCQPSTSRDSSYCYSTIRTHHDHGLGRHIGAAVTAVVIAFVIASEGRAGRASYSSSI